MVVEAAVIGGEEVSGAGLVGVGIYGLLGLADRWANRG